MRFYRRSLHKRQTPDIITKRMLTKTASEMCPPAIGEYAGTQGLGLLRLHSTYRHDLKIYASDEGRVQMTAAAFAKGLLALEGELTPILVQMVKSANTNGLLDNDCDSYKHQNMWVSDMFMSILLTLCLKISENVNFSFCWSVHSLCLWKSFQCLIHLAQIFCISWQSHVTNLLRIVIKY